MILSVLHYLPQDIIYTHISTINLSPHLQTTPFLSIPIAFALSQLLNRNNSYLEMVVELGGSAGGLDHVSYARDDLSVRLAGIHQLIRSCLKDFVI